MKKFIVAIAFLLVLVSAISASADYDLSGMSYEELLNLVSQAQREMMTRSEYQEVTVPMGIYKIGEEIPAGKWQITKANDNSYVYVNIGSQLADNMLELKGFSYVKLDSDTPSMDFTLPEGMYIWIEKGPVIFSTPTGPSFSFK